LTAGARRKIHAVNIRQRKKVVERLKQRRASRQYRQAVLNLLEQEVRQFPETVRELDEERENIIQASSPPQDGMPRGRKVSDTTLQRVMQLYNSTEIREMGRRVRAIEQAKNEFCARDPRVRLRFIELKFWDRRLTNDGIALELSIGESTVRLWRKKFLTLVGLNLGWRM
jgi:RinA family phage transcriptional activator